MNSFNQLRRTKVIAIKNFDEELYRIVKTYASLEGRTIASIFEEAIRLWISMRGGFDEVRLWIKLEQAYKENFKVFKENAQQFKEKRGYALICDGRIVGVFNSYEDVIKKLRKTCRVHSLIVKLPYKEEAKEIELGLPW